MKALTFPVEINCSAPVSIARTVDVQVDSKMPLQPRVVWEVRSSHFHNLVEFIDVGSGRMSVSCASVARSGTLEMKHGHK